MSRFLKLAPHLVFAFITVMTAVLSNACGGSATTSGDHAVGAGASGGAGAMGGSVSTGGQSGSGGAGGSGGKTGQLSAGSWQMTGVVTQLQENPGIQVCDTFTFTLNVAPSGSGYVATIGQDGFIDGVTAEITNDRYVLGGLTLPCGTQLMISSLTLRGMDTDGDGKADGLSGTVSGTAYSGGGDVVTSEAVQIDLTGVPDVTAPTLKQPSQVDPLIGFLIAASEPLTSTASLSLTGTTTVALSAVPAVSSSLNTPLDDAILWSADVILPLSGQWSVQGKAQDPSAHPLDPTATLRTSGDPGVFVQDGFEGALVAAVEAGTPAIVTGLGSVPAISGAHSLWIAPGDAVLFHLKRNGAGKAVHFSARAFGQFGGPSFFNVDIRVGVVGSKTIVPAGLSSTGDPVDTGDANWTQATPVQEFTLPLGDTGNDVLLRVSTVPCNGFCAPPSALMVDDLTLE